MKSFQFIISIFLLLCSSCQEKTQNIKFPKTPTFNCLKSQFQDKNIDIEVAFLDLKNFLLEKKLLPNNSPKAYKILLKRALKEKNELKVIQEYSKLKDILEDIDISACQDSINEFRNENSKNNGFALLKVNTQFIENYKFITLREFLEYILENADTNFWDNLEGQICVMLLVYSVIYYDFDLNQSLSTLFYPVNLSITQENQLFLNDNLIPIDSLVIKLNELYTSYGISNEKITISLSVHPKTKMGVFTDINKVLKEFNSKRITVKKP